MTFALQYVGLDEKTMRKSYIEIDGKLWYDDGLIGYLDEDDYLYLTSRVKEMIISGGVNIFPNEIEEVIKRHPKVLDVAVVRAPDQDLGEVPAAVIQLKEGEQATSAEIIEHCKQAGLYGFKLPKIVDFVEQLPRNLAGKLPKKQLEEQYWQGLERHG
jgi:long-chain acyl-CoA synthetase